MSAVRTKGLLANVGISSDSTKGLLAEAGISPDLYNTDYYAWTLKVKQMLESRAYDQLDVVNLIDEVNDMGINLKLEYSPSLKHQLDELFAKAYARARKDASLETGIRLTTFPEQCPYSLEQALKEDWLPAA